MKITIEIPDTVLVMTYQYVWENPDKYFAMELVQKAVDTETLKAMKEAGNDDNV